MALLLLHTFVTSCHLSAMQPSSMSDFMTNKTHIVAQKPHERLT